MTQTSIWRTAAGRVAALVLAAAAVSGSASAAHAWNADGHRQVADIAWTRLTPAARAKITTILLGSAEVSRRPTDGSDEAARIAFRNAATFPDDIKRDYETAYEPLVLSENQAFTVSVSPHSSEGIRCKTWHYYDTPIRIPAGTPAPAIDPSNALAALNRAADKLHTLAASNGDVGTQFWYLTWVEHLVGDLHQPLHCVSSYQFSPTGDAGGNLFLLAPSASGRSNELHYLWDDGITLAATYSRKRDEPARGYEGVTARWEADTTLQPAPDEVKELNVASWIASGARLADTRVYTGITQGADPSEDYLATVKSVSERQAVLAGYRLAAMLNRTLGS